MLRALRQAAAAGRGVRRLVLERDPLLLQGREAALAVALGDRRHDGDRLLFFALTLAVVAFEALAQQRKWIVGGFPQSVFPIDPARPITYVDLVLASLPFLLAPLIVLPVVHGVSWRRAFSYRRGLSVATVLQCGDRAHDRSPSWGWWLSYLLEPKQFEFPARNRAVPFWTALAIGVILVQSLGEEVLFRGYLLRVWGAVLPYRLPVTAAVIALFVAGHLGNEDIKRDLLLNVVYFVAIEVISYALLFRTQNLAASAGLHWMNNVVALLAPTVPGQPTALALADLYRSGVRGGRQPSARPRHPCRQVLPGSSCLLVLLLSPRSPFYLPRPSVVDQASAPAGA